MESTERDTKVWIVVARDDMGEIQHEQEFPPEMEDHFEAAERHFEHISDLLEDCHVTLTPRS